MRQGLLLRLPAPADRVRISMSMARWRSKPSPEFPEYPPNRLHLGGSCASSVAGQLPTGHLGWPRQRECIMQGDAKVIDYLNKGLRSELTAINQYWLHYRLLNNWGLLEELSPNFGDGRPVRRRRLWADGQLIWR